MKIFNPLTDSGTIDLEDVHKGGSFGGLPYEHRADVELMAENNAREAKLWGKLLVDKRSLQERGYVIFKRGKRNSVDGRLLSGPQLVKLADRTRQSLTDSKPVV